jgi:ornithine cyclodeaminase/alanine dehydrogenase-like protein (mu-crystallin family)
MIPIKEGAITADHIYADLGEIVTRKKPARTSDSQITLFKSNGLAIQDVAASRLVYEKARAAGLGVEVDL